MRVAVNLTWLAPGRVGGSEEYLTRQLVAVDRREFELEFFVDPAFLVAHPGFAADHVVHTNPIDRAGRAGRIVAEHTWLNRRTRSADLVHHGGGTAPVGSAAPYLLTVHDLQYLTFPHYFSGLRRRYLRTMLPRSVRGAAITAVPSEFVRQEVIDAFGVAAESVVLVPHGIPAIPMPDADYVAAVRRRWGLGDRPFVVYPAITHPHKAHGRVVAMLDHLDDDTMLVLVGGVGAAETALARQIDASGHRARIVRTGRVAPADRDALVGAADALVFPSEFEGFGAPVVEAMELGTPVVCSDADALVEVVGDAGVIIDEHSPASWADGVAMARHDRDRLVTNGRRRRERYTLETSAHAIMGAYRQAGS